MRLLRIPLAVGIILILGCQKAPDPKRLGIFADTDDGLIELTSFGEQTGRDHYKAPENEFPSVHEVRNLFINMPDANISNSQLLWTENLLEEFTEREASSLGMETEIVEGSMYKIRIFNQLDKTGVLILKVGMPMGTADRIYPLRIER